MATEFRIPFLRDRRSCEEVRALMSDRLDDDLDDRTRRRVDRHVRFCPRCRRVLGNLRATIDGLVHLRSPGDDESESELIERLRRSWRDSDSPSSPPGA